MEELFFELLRVALYRQELLSKKPYSFETRTNGNMVIRYFDFENVRVNKVPDEKELYKKYPLKAWQCNLTPGMFLGKVTNGASVMGRGFYVLEAATHFELDGYCDAIKSEFELEETK